MHVKSVQQAPFIVCANDTHFFLLTAGCRIQPCSSRLSIGSGTGCLLSQSASAKERGLVNECECWRYGGCAGTIHFWDCVDPATYSHYIRQSAIKQNNTICIYTASCDLAHSTRTLLYMYIGSPIVLIFQQAESRY